MNAIDDFKSLEIDGIVCETVTSFTLKQLNDVSYNHMNTLTNRSFLRFFNVFPNIRNLAVIIEEENRFDQFYTPHFSDVMSDTKFSFTPIYHQLSNMGQQLENLTLHIHYHLIIDVQIWKKVSEIQFENLKELSLIMNNLRDLDIQNVLLRFKHLTDPICTVDSRNFHSSLLNNATELRSLTIEMVFLFPFTWDA